MVGTIVRIIESAARKGTDEGILKYEIYFVKTNIFFSKTLDISLLPLL